MADDSFIPAESLEAFKSALDSVNANYEYIAYPGVTHSFTSKAADEYGEKFDMPLAYNSGRMQSPGRVCWSCWGRFLGSPAGETISMIVFYVPFS